MYKFSVEGGVLDFVGEPKIILMTSDPGEYAFGKAHKTYPVKLLDTANNRRILGDETKMEASLTIDDVTYKGLLFVDRNENGVKYGQFVSGIGEIWDGLRGLKLTGLDFSEHNHVLNHTNVIASEAGGFYVYDLIDRGVKIDRQERGFASVNVYDIIERYPSFNVWGIIQKIFEGCGIIRNLPTWFDNLYLIFTGKTDIRNSDEWLQTAPIQRTSVADQTASQSVAGSLGSFALDINPVEFDAGLWTYTAPETGTYRFVVDLPVVVRAAVTNSGVEITEDITLTSNIVVFVVSSTRGNIMIKTIPVNQTTNRNTNINKDGDVDTRYFELTKGEQIRIRLQWNGDYAIDIPPATPGANFTLNAKSGSDFLVKCHRYYGVGSTVDVASLMPDVEVLAFVRGLLEWFNISIYYNQITNQVYLWHENYDSVIDWSDKILTDNDIVSEIPEAKKYQYSFATDSFRSDDKEFFYGEGDIRPVQLYFADLYMRYVPAGAVPVMYSGEPIDITADNGDVLITNVRHHTEGTPRIASYKGTIALSYTMLFTNIGGAHTTYTATYANRPNFTMNTPNLYMETFSPPGGTIIEKGIFDNYHRKMIESLNEGERMTCVLLLKSEDILNMVNLEDGKDWRTAVHIDGKNYRVLELEQLEGNIYKGRFQEVYL